MLFTDYKNEERNIHTGIQTSIYYLFGKFGDLSKKLDGKLYVACFKAYLLIILEVLTNITCIRINVLGNSFRQLWETNDVIRWEISKNVPKLPA